MISGLYLLVKFIIEVIFEFRVMCVIFLMVKCNVVYVVMIVILIKIILKWVNLYFFLIYIRGFEC